MSWIAVVFQRKPSLHMFWTPRLFNLCWPVGMIFKRETEMPDTPYTPMAIRIHIYNYISVLFIAEKPLFTCEDSQCNINRSGFPKKLLQRISAFPGALRSVLVHTLGIASNIPKEKNLGLTLSCHSNWSEHCLSEHPLTLRRKAHH